MAIQDRGISGVLSDNDIRQQILQRWAAAGIGERHVYVMVREGRVLVSGAVTNRDIRADAIEGAWRVESVRQVINEVEIQPGYNVGRFVRDVALVQLVQARLQAGLALRSVNVSVDCVDGVVFLLGTAFTEAEAATAGRLAAQVPGVRRVANHVITIDSPLRTAPRPA